MLESDKAYATPGGGSPSEGEVYSAQQQQVLQRTLDQRMTEIRDQHTFEMQRLKSEAERLRASGSASFSSRPQRSEVEKAGKP